MGSSSTLEFFEVRIRPRQIEFRLAPPGNDRLRLLCEAGKKNQFL
jgi:hypothetical protein